jgi:hypothetical protein
MITQADKLRAPNAAVLSVFLLCWSTGALAEETSEEAPRPRLVSTLDFEAAAYLSFLFAGLAVPDAGSLNPVGGGAYAAIRYVPASFPFHAYFETGGGLFATGTTTGSSGTPYDNLLSAWFFSPGAGFDWGPLRLTLGVGPALVFTNRSSPSEDTLTTSLAVAGDVGVSYSFFESKPWALSAGLRYQTIPGAKVDALSLGVRLRFGRVEYRK